MRVLIDQFTVKPQGFLAAKRHAKVFIETTAPYTITTETDIGRPLNEYKTNTRRDWGLSPITTFCDRTPVLGVNKSTKVSVFEADINPFAFVVIEENEASCGYVVPPNPTDPAGLPVVYSLYKTFNFCSYTGKDYTVNILKKNYTCGSEPIESGTQYPAILEYPNQDDYKLYPVHGSELTLGFISDADFSLQELYTEDERAFRVDILHYPDIEPVLFWRGFVKPDDCSEPFLAPPYPVTIKATDALGTLKGISYQLPKVNTSLSYAEQVDYLINPRVKWINILADCFSHTNLNLDFFTVVNLFESKMANGLNDDPLNQSYINPYRFRNEDNSWMSYYEVLEAICTQFEATVYQSGGSWHFVRVIEKAYGGSRRRRYMPDGTFMYAELHNPFVQVGHDLPTYYINADQIIRKDRPYKRVEVLYRFGRNRDTILNGDFELWTGNNPDYWTKYGGITIEKAQTVYTDSSGVSLLLDNFGMAFPNGVDLAGAGAISDGKYFQSQSKHIDPIPFQVFKGEQVTMEFNMGGGGYCYKMALIATLNGQRIKHVNNPEGGDSYLDWDTEVRPLIVAIKSDSSLKKDINTFHVAVSFPVCQQDGFLQVGIIGFHRYKPRKGLGNLISGADDLPYEKVTIDDFRFTINKPGEDDSKKTIGILYGSEQRAFYTYIPERKEILFGDNTDLDQTGNIYTVDKSYSRDWYDYGKSGAKLPIGLMLAKNILTNYHRPFSFFEGSFKSETFNFDSVCSLNCMPVGYYMPISAAFNLKDNSFQANLIEVNSIAPVTKDVTVIATKDTSLQSATFNNPFINPKPCDLPENAGIFTREFNNVFV